MNPLSLRHDARVLVVILRRLGDVLLTTPLIRSLKRAYPHAAIDALVFAGTEGVLAGNPDLAQIITMPARPRLADALLLSARLFRRYDLAIAAQTGDRPIAFAILAGRRSIGPLEPTGAASAVKRALLSGSYVSDRSEHRVVDILHLADLIGIPAHREVVCPPPAARAQFAPAQPYVVVHAAPMFVYKRWTAEGWAALAAAMRQRGFTVAATGGASDRDYLDAIWRDTQVVRLDGKLAWPELTTLIAGARVYIGPDTAITHLAAATGAPTVALYGPTDPRLWGPWPRGGLQPPWQKAGKIQRCGNVWLVQNPLPCLPCQLEGCERRVDSHSQCLDELTVTQVLAAVDQALAMRQAA